MRKELHEQKLKDDKFSKGFKEEADKKISDLNLLIVNLEEALRAKEKNVRNLSRIIIKTTNPAYHLSTLLYFVF